MVTILLTRLKSLLMKKIIAFIVLPAMLISCSAEEIPSNETSHAGEQLARGLKDGMASAWGASAWKGLKLEIDFSKFFEYNKTAELQRLSDKEFASIISEFRYEITQMKDIDYIVSTIEITNGKAKFKEHFFVGEGNAVLEQYFFHGDCVTGHVTNVRDVYYSLSPEYSLLNADADANIESIGQYLYKNLVSSTDKVMIQIKVSPEKAEVYSKKV